MLIQIDLTDQNSAFPLVVQRKIYLLVTDQQDSEAVQVM
jgi:hypothetical protein